MAIQDRGYSNHYVESDITILAGDFVEITHGMGHEPDLAILKVRVAGTVDPTATAPDRFTVVVTNPNPAEDITLDAVLTFWHSVVK